MQPPTARAARQALSVGRSFGNIKGIDGVAGLQGAGESCVIPRAKVAAKPDESVLCHGIDTKRKISWIKPLSVRLVDFPLSDNG